MKTFKDLVFEPHKVDPTGTRAIMNFDNDYGVSVITGSMFYTDEGHPYEIAIMYNDTLCYTTPITDDVIGHQTDKDITKVMRQVQLLNEEV